MTVRTDEPLLTVDQLDVLRWLAEHGAAVISNRTDLTQAKLAGATVKALEVRGLVDRDDHQVLLSPAGRSALTANGSHLRPHPQDSPVAAAGRARAVIDRRTGIEEIRAVIARLEADRTAYTSLARARHALARLVEVETQENPDGI